MKKGYPKPLTPEPVPNRETREAIEAGERGEVFRASTVAELMEELHADD